METKRKSFTADESMIGKYVNRHLYTDVYPIGKIVGIKSKTILLIQPIEASPNEAKMEFWPGGFSAHCPNNYAQKYSYHEVGEVFEIRMNLGSRDIRIDDRPIRFYDYNF